AILRDAAPVLEHDGEVVAARGPLHVARPIVEARGDGVVLGHAVGVLVHLSGEDAGRGVVHGASVLVQGGAARLVLLAALAEGVGGGEGAAAIRRARVALTLASGDVGARTEGDADLDDAGGGGGLAVGRRPSLAAGHREREREGERGRERRGAEETIGDGS